MKSVALHEVPDASALSLLSASTSAPWATGDWIICVGAERPVVEGMVRCPLRGSVEISTCIDCRFLETMAAERRPDRECGAGTDLAS